MKKLLALLLCLAMLSGIFAFAEGDDAPLPAAEEVETLAPGEDGDDGSPVIAVDDDEDEDEDDLEAELLDEGDEVFETPAAEVVAEEAEDADLEDSLAGEELQALTLPEGTIAEPEEPAVDADAEMSTIEGNGAVPINTKNFPDAAFRKFVEDTYGVNKVLNTATAGSVSALHLNGRGIKSLKQDVQLYPSNSGYTIFKR